MHKIRVILDTQEDVIRTLVVNSALNLETLHFTIAKAFGFDGKEMASFYRTDEEWNQGEEIPLFDMAEAGQGVSMSSCVLGDTLPQKNDKLIYVYDFLNLWAFYVEIIEITNETIPESKVVLSVGEVPEKAPEKQFQADDLSDEIEDEFNNFERFDDFDFENY